MERTIWRPREQRTLHCALRGGGGSVLTRKSLPTGLAGKRRLAAMVRAGHGFELARAVVDAEPGSELDLDELREKSR